MVKSRTSLVQAFARLALVAPALVCSGCMSLENEEGRLPDAMRSSITALSAKGYPDLSKIPASPVDIPTTTAWSSVETGLTQDGRAIVARPEAAALKPEDTNLSWADQDRAALESDPRAEPLAVAPAGAPASPDWAVEARKKLEADIARLPPP